MQKFTEYKKFGWLELGNFNKVHCNYCDKGNTLEYFIIVNGA